MTENDFYSLLIKNNIPIDKLKLDKLKRYYELLIEWNKVMNLTTIINIEEVYLKHFYDSLTVSKVINLNKKIKICDVGTGAGFPGLVLKIVYPQIELTLIDSLQKRIKFLNAVIDDLNIKGVECIHARIEDYASNNREKFDMVIARAVAPLNVLLEYLTPLAKLNGNVIAMKGDSVEEEKSAKTTVETLNLKVFDRKEFYLLNNQNKRTLLNFLKQNKTPGKYPRRLIDIKKKPL